jgi:hypothetical protein
LRQVATPRGFPEQPGSLHFPFALIEAAGYRPSRLVAVVSGGRRLSISCKICAQRGKSRLISIGEARLFTERESSRNAQPFGLDIPVRRIGHIGSKACGTWPPQTPHVAE